MSLISLADARHHVLERCGRLAPVTLDLDHALGAVAACDCVAADPVPAFDNTSMDGFAVRAADTVGASDDHPVTLAVVATIPAGMAPDVSLGPDQAVRIMTGAPIPVGADAIVPVEATRSRDDADLVDVLTGVEPGTHIRRVGEDMAPGDVVFGAGSVLHPGHIGLLARVGATTVDVVRPPRVAVLSTGDELVAGSDPMMLGQIRDSNRPTLMALVREAGYEAVDMGLIPDDDVAIRDAIGRAVSTCDAVVTSGGVSMGDFDLVKVVLDELGEMRWMQIAIKPAKPLAFGVIPSDANASDVITSTALDTTDPVRSVPVFGLPGNPVSAMVSFELFVRPALRRMAGHSDEMLDRPMVRAIADETLERRPDGKTYFVRVVCTHGFDGLHHVRSAGPQGSHQLSVMAEANALAVLPDGPEIRPGDVVDVMLLR